jgi:histone H3/H4
MEIYIYLSIYRNNMSLIVKNNIKDAAELQVSEEVYIELEKKVEDIIKKAEQRAKANSRRTIFARDL